MGPLETGEGTESSGSRGSGKPASATLGRFACGWTRFGSFSAAGRDIGPVDPFGFSWPLAVSLRKPPLMAVGFSWISLDSLVRIETFQRVTRLEAEKSFSSRFFHGVRSAPTGACALGIRKRRLVHGASLPQFLIFCNRLSSEPFPFGRPDPKAARPSPPARMAAMIAGAF
jgi:hypothetical protein